MGYMIRNTSLGDDDGNCFLTQYNVTTSKYSDTEYRRAIVFGSIRNALHFISVKDAIDIMTEIQNDPDHNWGGLCLMTIAEAEHYAHFTKKAAQSKRLEKGEEMANKEKYVIRNICLNGREDCFLNKFTTDDYPDHTHYAMEYDKLSSAIRYDNNKEASNVLHQILKASDYHEALIVETVEDANKYLENLGKVISEHLSTGDECATPKSINDTFDTISKNLAAASKALAKDSDNKSLGFEDEEDVVNHPAHYENDNYQCIDVMEDIYGTEAVMNFCMCNAFKYIWRFQKKNGIEDIQKAQWYMNKYQELAETITKEAAE